MKELSIEEKARAYDEAIKKAAALYKASEPMSGCNVIIETLFPELVESEGEKIRKTLIDFFGKSAKYGGQTNGVYDKDILAWLERQGEQIDTANKEYWRGYREGKKLILDKYAETEKQNGQDILEDAILYGNEDGLIAETIRYKHEKQSEQKSDKVEPKFKVGDWIINPKTGNVLQIKNVLLCGNKGNYEFDYSSMPIESVDKHYHLWTIEDAKDGDVLAFKNDICGIIICKSPTDYDTISYCRLVNDTLINKEESGWDSTLLVPATEEQRSLLFHKMKDAGYEWDARNKVMTKIEQKSIDSYCQENCKGFQETGKCFVDGDCKAKREAEQKPAWSEEDEELLKWSINNLTELKDRFGEEYGKVGKCIDWVKSLKDRVQPKPKQEWSEEDEINVYNIIHFLEEPSTLENNEPCKKIVIAWLKSLRPQNRWKPSDEQMEALYKASKNEYLKADQYDVLSELWNNLKKLKDK